VSSATRIPIVVIDDDVRIRRVLASWIEEDDRFVLVGEAAGGIEALGLIGRTDPAAIVLDLHLPSVDGFALLRTLVRQDPDRAVVVLTGDESLLDAAIEHGATASFAKGAPLADLFDAAAAGVQPNG
jgi:DNA-binding NarL/FixJ family response regulator